MGSLDVLSAVIVGCMMLSAVVYVATFDAPETTARENVDVLLQRSARDFLHMYNEWPLTEPCDGNTMLERFLIDGLNGDSAEWDRRISTQFPLGTDISLLLDNGEALYPLQERWQTTGSTYDVTFQPEWDQVLPIAATDAVDGTNAFVADIFAARHSSILAPRGETVETTLEIGAPTGASTIRATALTAHLPLEV